jgi:hypothetical protein
MITNVHAQDVFQSCVRAIPDVTTLEQMCEAGGVLSPELYTNFTFAGTPSSDASTALFLPPVHVS